MSCVGSWADTSLEGSGCDLSLGGTQKGSHASDLFSSRSSSASQEAEPAPTLLPAHLEVPGAVAEASVEIKATSEPEECPPPASALELQATTTSIPAAALDQAPACGWLLQELTEKSPVLPEKPSPALVPDPAEAMRCHMTQHPNWDNHHRNLHPRTGKLPSPTVGRTITRTCYGSHGRGEVGTSLNTPESRAASRTFYKASYGASSSACCPTGPPLPLPFLSFAFTLFIFYIVCMSRSH